MAARLAVVLHCSAVGQRRAGWCRRSGGSAQRPLGTPGKVARGINGRSVEPKTNAHLLQIPSLENSTSQSRNFNASSQEDSFLAMLGLGAAGGQAGGSPGRWNGSANFAGPLAGTQSSSSVQPRSDADRPTPPSVPPPLSTRIRRSSTRISSPPTTRRRTIRRRLVV